MHVALFSPSWPLARYPNGIVTYVHWMREELRRQGHRVSIFTGAQESSEEDVYVIRPSVMRRALEKIRSKFSLNKVSKLDWAVVMADTVRAVHRKTAIDVIEMEESFGWMYAVQQHTRIPVVVKLHGPAFMSLVEEELNTPSADAKIEAEGAALRCMQVVISPALRTLVETIDRYGLAPAVARHVVNPLQLPFGTPMWDLDSCDHKTVLFVGRFDKRKGGDIVLHAFARLLVDHPDLKLLFVGPDYGVLNPDGLRVRFEEMKRSLFSDRVSEQISYLGKLLPQDIYHVRTRALVTVIASRWENQSYTALEAMLQGCPVVSSDAGGQGETIEHGVSGLLAAAGNAEDLARQVKVCIDDPRRAAEMGARGRELVIERHAPERVVSQTLDAYRNAISLAPKSALMR